MFTNLQNANIKVSSWLLKESRMCVFSKEVMRNEITFYERKGRGLTYRWLFQGGRTK